MSGDEIRDEEMRVGDEKKMKVAPMRDEQMRAREKRRERGEQRQIIFERIVGDDRSDRANTKSEQVLSKGDRVAEETPLFTRKPVAPSR